MSARNLSPGSFIAGLIVITCASVSIAADRPARPNFVVIFTDDQGYQDVGCFGSPDIATPNLDKLAEHGRRFTSFCVSQAVCSASRCSLLTGCYPNRVGIRGALGPKSTTGLHDDELTLGEMAQSRGYATAAYGKWHLGYQPEFLPSKHGFDDYYGLPYSNDMWPYHPTAGDNYPPLPLIDGDTVIGHNPDQTRLTTDYTTHAVEFIEAHHDEPFLLYVAHSMPHVPLFVSDKHQGVSPRGLYGDVITEIDWSVGQIVDTIDRLDLGENTVILFTSDNGPWLSYGNHSGSALPLREGKGTAWEGGVREPCIMRWTGQIPAGTECNELAATIDVLPTFAGLCGADVPDDRIIDGKNIWPLMSGQADAKSPHEAYYYYYGDELQAIRSGPWKLHFPHKYRSLDGPGGNDGQPAPYVQRKTGLELYNLETDVSESTDVAADNPEIVARLEKLAEIARTDLGDSATNRKGKGRRQPGRAPAN